MDKAKAVASYFENMSLVIIGLFLFALPLFFLSITTDAFVLPKEIALIAAIGAFAIFFVLKIISEGKLTFRNSPFDVPLLLFVIVLAFSAIFSANRYDALIAFAPYIFILFLYFSIVNIVKGKNQLLFVLGALVLGATTSSVLSIFSFFKIYLLPFPYSHTPAFNTFGSFLDQAIYLALILPIAGQFVYRHFKATREAKRMTSPFEGVEPKHLPKETLGILIYFSVSFVIILVSLGITTYLLATSQKPTILPLETGLQTAFAAISQDTGNILKSLFLGSGIGTFLNDFTRFKAASYNANPQLWAFTFFRSSSYVLELIATTGLLGFAAFLFLIYRIFRERAFFFPLLLAIIAAFILPFSFTLTILFFILLAIFAVDRIASNNRDRVSEIEFYFVAFKKRFFGAAGQDADEGESQKRHGRFLSIIISIIILVLVGVPFYFATRYLISDILFQKALVAASQNQGLQTYDLEVQAIKTFPYRDVYYRAFAQTNLALASLLVSQRKDNQPLSQEVQQNILTLIQQSINAGRSATSVAPLTAFNWNNLSSIYRSLIGFGENADKFTLLTSQQAIALDPNNPQQYIDFGGVYYQLGNYDDSIRQFQYALTLKPDYANAYYNLGHALEMKGNNEQALQAYQAVKQLVGNDPTNSAKIDAEIQAIQAKTGGAQANAQGTQQQPTEQQQPISVNQPSTQLPERDPRAQIPEPTISPAIPTPTRIPSVTPAP